VTGCGDWRWREKHLFRKKKFVEIFFFFFFFCLATGFGVAWRPLFGLPGDRFWVCIATGFRFPPYDRGNSWGEGKKKWARLDEGVDGGVACVRWGNKKILGKIFFFFFWEFFFFFFFFFCLAIGFGVALAISFGVARATVFEMYNNFPKCCMI
jgi:hypothetical protein